MAAIPARVRIKFDGHDFPHGKIDLYDFAETILAFGQTAERIARNENLLGDENRLRIDVNALEAGSFHTELLMCVEPVRATLPLLPAAGAVVQNAQHVVDVLKGVIKLKRWLKGQKPASAHPVQTGDGAMMNVYNLQGENMTVHLNVFQNAQDTQVTDGLTKIAAPMKREGSPIESITIGGDGDEASQPETLKKEEVPYIEETEEAQTIPSLTIKGIVTAFDTKTLNGRVSLSDRTRRVTFELAGVHPAEYDKSLHDLIESMDMRVVVRLIGEATLDMDGNVKRLKVTKVEPETRLI